MWFRITSLNSNYTFLENLKNKWTKLLSLPNYVPVYSLLGVQVGEKQNLFIYIYIKSKAVPLQAWSGPEGSRKLRFHRPGVAQRVPGS